VNVKDLQHQITDKFFVLLLQFSDHVVSMWHILVTTYAMKSSTVLLSGF